MTTITGLYHSAAAAAHAVHLLEKSGVPSSNISLLTTNAAAKKELSDEPHSKAPEGMAIGAAGGGTLGGVIAGVVALSSIASGGASLGLLVAGPIATALMGAGAGAAAGSAIGGMIGAAIPEPELKYYESAIEHGAVLISVKTGDRDQPEGVRATMLSAGAEKISGA